MFAYVDETGNTGPNLFDENQPDFFTGALVTRANFDLVYRPQIEALCRQAGAASLHASVVGRGVIETVAPGLLRILKKADARFFLSRVEKRYLLATKLFDTFFDSGENPAVPWTAYNFRVLRLILSFKVASLVTYDTAQEFWSMLMARNEKTARAMIPGICASILAEVNHLPDPRSRQIVTEALEWSRDHPEALDIFIAGRQAKNGHMPNMVAFANLLDGLEHISKRWDRPLRKIVHDRQSQFEQSLAEWHRIFSNASDEPIERPDETIVFQKVHGSTFEVSASDASPGIQVADLILWLFRQMTGGNRLPGPNSAALLQYALKKGWQNDFSFSGVSAQVEAALERVMESDLSEEQMAAGRQLSEKVEHNRQEAMRLYEEDGLMPYQRERRERLPET